jgi:hypothetical protein
MRLPYSKLRTVHRAIGPALALFIYSPSLPNDPLALWPGLRVARRARAASPKERTL